jgi:cytochrome P450
MTVLAAGSETSRAALNSLIWSMATHPDELRKVRDDRSLAAGAVEEALRWVCPPRGFMRTAQCDTELRGKRIVAGQHLYLLYMAANRDEEVFPNPETFDVSRKESKLQLAFGFGTHVCVAAALVRLEAGILLNAILDRFSSIEMAGEPEPIIALLRQGWHNMPVAFRV